MRVSARRDTVDEDEHHKLWTPVTTVPVRNKRLRDLFRLTQIRLYFRADNNISHARASDDGKKRQKGG